MKVESSRIVQLDGLRGIAIGLVLLFHLNLLAPTGIRAVSTALLFGWSGVDLFFILSGFLIGGILIDNRDSENYFVAFYARRFFRIIPIYYLIVATYFAFYLVSGLRANLVDAVGPPMPWYSYLSFTNNIWIARHNYMDAFASPTWSLAIEEQFYLTLPLVVRIVKPKWFPATIGALIAIIAGFRIAMCLCHNVTQIQSYVLPFFRADALMIGVACALAVRSRSVVAFFVRTTWVLYVALLAFTGIVIRTGGKLLPDTAAPINTYGLTAVALLYATLLMISVVLPRSPIGRALCFRPLRSLGKLAYFVYLLHVSVLLATYDTLNNFSIGKNTFVRWAVGIASLAIVIFAANISWNKFESRMIRLGHRFQFSKPRPEPEIETVLPLAS